MPLFVALLLLAAPCYSLELLFCGDNCIQFHENNPPVATVHNEELVCRHVDQDTGVVTLRAAWESVRIGAPPSPALHIKCVYPRYPDEDYTVGEKLCQAGEGMNNPDEPACQSDARFFTGRLVLMGEDKTFSYSLWYPQADPEKLEKVLRNQYLCMFKVMQKAAGGAEYRKLASNPVGFTIPDYKYLTAPSDFRYQWHDSQGYKFQWRLDRSPCDQVLCPDRKQYLVFHGFRFLFPSGVRWLITGNSLPIDRVALVHFCDTSPSMDSPVIFNPKRTESEDMYPDFNQIPEVKWLAEVEASLHAGSLRFSCRLRYAGADQGAEGIRLPELQLQVAVIKARLTESFVRAGLLTVEHRAGHLYLVSCQRRRHDQWEDVQKNCVVVSDDREVLKKSPDFCKFQGRTEL